MVNQMLTGHTPFWGLTDRDVRRAILSAPLSFEKQVAAAAQGLQEVQEMMSVVQREITENRLARLQPLLLPSQQEPHLGMRS